jgi:uncharacterized protein (TIGR02266 family)
LADNENETGAEKRQYRRAPIMLKVRYRAAQDFLADYTENVSEGGVFVATEEKFEEGTELDFEISFPGLLDPIPLRGVVKWCRPHRSPEEPAGIGIQFLFDRSPGRGLLATLVDKLDNREKEEPPEQPEETEQRQLFRVLLVEDNVVVRDMFRYGIQKLTRRNRTEGTILEVEEADNGKQAWDMLKKKQFNLLVLDLYMPVMGGDQLIQYVRQDPALKDIPIIVVSSGGRDDHRRAIQSGADIFLSKPIKLKEMVETVEALISTGHSPK